MMPQEQAPQQQSPEAPEAPEQDSSAGMMVPAAALGEQGANAKPGDTLSFTVSAVHGDMLELEPCDDQEEGDEMPSADEAKKMPMDELESKLPTAER